MTRLALIATLPLALAFAGPSFAASNDATMKTGEAAFGTWKDDAPGVQRLIKPADLPAPFVTQSASNAPRTTPIKAGVKPKVMDGFSVDMVATGMQGPRVIRTAPNGDLFIADSVANEIHVFRMTDGSPKPAEDSVFAAALNQPYGIAFYPLGPNPEWVYVGNADSIVRFPYKNGDLKATGKPETIVASLPSDYHWTRDVVFSPDGKKMYVSVGSGSNIGEEVTGAPEGGIQAWAASHPLGAMWADETDRADVLAFNPDGSGKQILATGLRNCSGMTMQPVTNALWCVVNERDELGDNVPFDYATAVKAGAFYGWPWYYIGNHEDPRAPLKGQRPDLAGKATVPDVLFQAHSAPLGITFYEGSNFPAEYKGNAFVTMHGSWNRGNRTGYKVVRVLFDASGKPTGAYQDFMTGFVNSDQDVWGRPVGLAVAKDGSLFVTEDGSGTIWRVSHNAASAS